jgi:uncharacterized protein
VSAGRTPGAIPDATPGATPFNATSDGVRVRLKVAPGARRTGIGAVEAVADGAVLKVQVTAPPEGGKANAAVLKTLAKAWRLPKSHLAITAGAGARRKTVHVAGDAGDLMQHFNEWMETHHA